MNIFQLALKALKKHWLRATITCILFSVALAAIAVGIAYPFARIEQNYVRYLEKQKINTLAFQLQETQSIDDLIKTLPDGVKSYGAISGNNYHLSQVKSINKFKKEDLELFQAKLITGRLPENENEMALSLDAYKELEQTGIQCINPFDINENYWKKFTNYAEAQEIFRNRGGWGSFFESVNLTGLVDTGVNVEKVAALKQQANDPNNEDAKAALEKHQKYSFGNCVFTYFDRPINYKNGFYLINLPKDKQAKVQMFSDMRKNLEAKWINGWFQTDLAYQTYTVMEEGFSQQVDDAVSGGLNAFLLLAPLGCVFLLIAFVLMVSLESMSIKSSRDEIGVMRMLGASNGKVRGIGFVRALLSAAVSFLLSIIFAFLLQYFLYGRDTIDGFNVVNMLSFVTFLITLGVAVVVSMLSIGLAYLRYRKKMPSEIMRAERD